MRRSKILLYSAFAVLLLVSGAVFYVSRDREQRNLETEKPDLPNVGGPSGGDRTYYLAQSNEIRAAQTETHQEPSPAPAASAPAPAAPDPAKKPLIPPSTVYAVSQHYSQLLPKYQAAKSALEEYKQATPELYTVKDEKVKRLSNTFRLIAFDNALKEASSSAIFQSMLNDPEFFQFARQYMHVRSGAVGIDSDMKNTASPSELATKVHLAAQRYRPEYERLTQLMEVPPDISEAIRAYSSTELQGKFIQQYMGDHRLQYAPPAKRFLTSEETEALKASLR